MRRFERIHDVVESVEAYRPGGYHPVRLGDIFNERYEIIGKLAYGQFSTVWLACDNTVDHHVALKILKADDSTDNQELATLLRLSPSNTDHPGKDHVLQLLDHFYHTGPNGRHLCLVLPVMACDGEDMTLHGKPRHTAYVRQISKQVLLGLDFLQEKGMIHCDLQPANVLFSTIDAAPDGVKLEAPEFSPVRWLEGVTPDEFAPEYLIPSQKRQGQLNRLDSSEILVKIGDLGGVMHNRKHNSKPVMPVGLRAPELVLRKTWDASLDVWTLGCLIFQLATNEALFPVGTFGLSAEQIDEEYLSQVNQLLGGQGDLDERFAKHLADRLPGDFGDENIQQLTEFLLSMLQRDAGGRLSTAQLLEHPFLQTGS